MKLLIPVENDCIAPRFDTATDVLVATCYDQKLIEEPRFLLLSDPSAEALCDMVLKERIQVVICCGIEEEHYSFLKWKKVTVLDSVIGRWQAALDLAVYGTLEAGSILR